MLVEAGAGDVAEEVRLALRTRGEHCGGLGADTHEHFIERRADAGLESRKAAAAELAGAGLLEVRQLLEELLQPERTLQDRQEVDEQVTELACLVEGPPKQSQPAVDSSLLAGDPGSGGVVRAR